MTYNVRIKAQDGKVVKDVTGLDREQAQTLAWGYGVEQAGAAMAEVDEQGYVHWNGARCTVYVERTHFGQPLPIEPAKPHVGAAYDPER